MSRVATALLFLLVSITVSAHGELDKRIKEISIKILQDPSNTSLFLERGELYFQHEDYQLSIKDFKICEERDYISDRLNLNIARAFRVLKEFEFSDLYADKILAQQPRHVRALKVKAKTAFDKNDFKRSANLFKQVISFVDVANTDNYYEAFTALEYCGTKECLFDALTVLESGIEDLGELMVFLEKGVSFSLRLKDFDKAHQYQNKIIQNAQRKERIYYQKALLFKEQGNDKEAQNMFQNSLIALESLPSRVKENRASKRLKAQIVEELSSFQ